MTLLQLMAFTAGAGRSGALRTEGKVPKVAAELRILS